MRYRLTSGLATRLAAAMAVLCAIPSQVRAWDEERVSSEIQPYFGVWAGSYMANTDDLFYQVGDKEKKILGDDYFLKVVPAGGVSFGAAYGRVHAGVNVGYQMLDGATNKEKELSSIGLYSKYQYQVIPIDISLDVAMLRNEAPVNLLLGGSFGIGLVGIRNPFTALGSRDSLDTLVSFYYNDWSYTNALLATGYVGARINLARRLNLEGQIGWRVLKSDAMELGESKVTGRADEARRHVDSTRWRFSYAPVPIDLSGAYFRADLRWTFASQVERDEEKRTVQRVRDVREALALAALRPYRVSAR
ncbi:MAG: hypothetical protein IPK50_23175 [Fibrobacterota bacterium]|nr:hypothetical protein [Fibrobacterota bacterium]QQS05137.1 MAG: hypothetical protein IPK50_23175 [Fibrobacterota bacterium]